MERVVQLETATACLPSNCWVTSSASNVAFWASAFCCYSSASSDVVVMRLSCLVVVENDGHLQHLGGVVDVVVFAPSVYMGFCVRWLCSSFWRCAGNGLSWSLL